METNTETTAQQRAKSETLWNTQSQMGWLHQTSPTSGITELCKEEAEQFQELEGMKTSKETVPSRHNGTDTHMNPKQHSLELHRSKMGSQCSEGDMDKDSHP